MPDLFTRYLSDDCQAVRCELIGLMDFDPSRALLAGALEVADEFVRRSADNLSRLYAVLLTLGYQFADPENALVLHASPNQALVTGFEEQMGKMPLLSSRWYRQIQSVNFTQAYAQFTDRRSPLSGLGWNVPFVVQSLTKALEQWEEHRRDCEADDRYRRSHGYEPEGPPAPALFTGGCASNNALKGFALPSARFDDVLYNEGFGDQYFGEEIARGFQYGGFPILSASESTLKTIRTLYGEPDREYLTTRLPRDLQRA